MTAPEEVPPSWRVSAAPPAASPAAPPTASPAASLRRELVAPVVTAAGGIAVGMLWALLAGPVAGTVIDVERYAAHDATMAVLCIVAGVVTATLLLAWPGPSPALRAGLTIVAAALAGYLAWGVGLSAGAPKLQATGVVLLWPLVTSAVVGVRSLVAVLLAP